MVAGIKTDADPWITIAITCKYMGWGYEQYQAQPLPLLQTVTMLRQLEAEEAERQSKYGHNSNGSTTGS